MGADKQIDGAPVREEFFTDAQVDFNTSFEDALLLEKFEVAQTQLDDFKSKNGESAAYLHRLGRLNEKKGKLKDAYEIYKRLYYEAPIFMRDKFELERIQSDVIGEKLNKGRALWNQVIARASHFIEENPDAHNRDNKEPYIKIFWEKQNHELDMVVQNFLSILAIEEYEMDALHGLLQCYSELENKERKAYIAGCINDAKIYWKEMVQKRSQASLLAAKKQVEGQHFDAVIAIVNLGLETEPTNQDLLLVKAEALQKLRQYHDALSCIIVVLKCNQNNSKAQRLKKSIEGQIFEQNLRDGLEYLFRAEQEKPGSAQQLARIETSLSFFLDALSFDAQNLSALAGVYRCHIRSGEPLKAQKTLERIRQIDANYDVYSIFRDKKDKVKQSETCFVATRVLGEMHPDTIFLRRFRDTCLRPFAPGRLFIALYRRVGPALARLSDSGPTLPLARHVIAKLVRLLRI